MLRNFTLVLLLIASAGSIEAEESHETFSRGWYAYTEGNYEEALSIWLPLAKSGDVDTEYYLGELYRDGLGDPATAVGWFEKAAGQGFVKAQNAMGSAYLNGNGVEKNAATAFTWFREATGSGDSTAQSYLGWMYEAGAGVDQSIEKALSWYRLAAKQDQLWSQKALGRIYSEGKSVEVDQGMSCYWFGRAAEQGDGFATYRFGYCFANGWGRQVDDEMAITLFRQAIGSDIADAVIPLQSYAENGEAEAQFALAELFSEGRLVSRDDKLAFSLAQSASEQGHSDSLALLGSFYLRGLGVPEDHRKAEELLLQGALANSLDAKTWLAVLYAESTDPLNNVKAYVWSDLVINHDSSAPDADPGDATVEMLIGFLEGPNMQMMEIQITMEEKLTGPQLLHAQQLSAKWDALYRERLPGVSLADLRRLTP